MSNIWFKTQLSVKTWVIYFHMSHCCNYITITWKSFQFDYSSYNYKITYQPMSNIVFLRFNCYSLSSSLILMLFHFTVWIEHSYLLIFWQTFVLFMFLKLYPVLQWTFCTYLLVYLRIFLGLIPTNRITLSQGFTMCVQLLSQSVYINLHNVLIYFIKPWKLVNYFKMCNTKEKRESPNYKIQNNNYYLGKK